MGGTVAVEPRTNKDKISGYHRRHSGMFWCSRRAASSNVAPTLHITLTATFTAVLPSISFNTIMGIDYYKLLGVGRDASEDDIKKAYKKMVGTTFLTGRASLIFTLCRR
jgi:hypothetical protein